MIERWRISKRIEGAVVRESIEGPPTDSVGVVPEAKYNTVANALTELVNTASAMDNQIHGEFGIGPYEEDEAIVKARAALRGEQG